MTTASADLVKKSMTALTSTVAGNEFATLLNSGCASALASHICVGAIVATNVSQTIDFGSLLVGDIVIRIRVAAGNTIFRVCATAGNLGAAAVVGAIYVVLRPISLPSDSAVLFP